MGGLSIIRTARLEVVFRTYGNIQFLFHVAVEITEQEAVSAVLILEPALVSRIKGLSRFVRGFERQSLLSRRRERGYGEEQKNGSHLVKAQKRVHPGRG